MSSPIKAWREQKKITKTLCLKGKIITWTKILVPPQGFIKDAPYFIAVVEMEDKKRLFGQVVGIRGDKIKTNSKVETVYRREKRPDKEGVIYYGVKFKII